MFSQDKNFMLSPGLRDLFGRKTARKSWGNRPFLRNLIQVKQLQNIVCDLIYYTIYSIFFIIFFLTDDFQSPNLCSQVSRNK